MMHRIRRAVARPNHTVEITWDDGTSSRVSFAEIIMRGPVFEAMRDPVYFAKRMTVDENGYALSWPDEVDFSADGLWHKAHPHDQKRDPAAAAE
jgi:Protein of unknown function (DUF2442)